MALKPTRISIDDLARLCLDHLVQNPDQLAEFMVQSGMTPAGLRSAIGTHAFAHGLVDYVMANEPLLVAIAGANGLSAEAIAAAWAHHQHSHHGHEP